MSSPKISIIVPVYNVEKYLRQCIDSILVQTFTNWECILVDDGSTDGSGAICDEYAAGDRRLKIYHGNNQGISSARNRGLNFAIGDWVVFIDSDDFIDKDYLYNIISCTKEGIDFIFMGYSLVDNNNNEINQVKFQYGEYIGDNKKYAIENIIRLGTPWAKAYRNDIIRRQRIRFNSNLSLSEDRLFLYYYLPFVKGICISDSIGYFYRKTPNSISARKRKPYEYLCRFDCLAESSLRIKKTWNVGALDFYPFLMFHLGFLESAIQELGVLYVKKNSVIACHKDYYGVYTNLSPKSQWLLNKKMGMSNYFLYNSRWLIYYCFMILTFTKHFVMKKLLRRI